MSSQDHKTLRPSSGLKLVLETEEATFLVGYFPNEEAAKRQRDKVLRRNPSWSQYRWILLSESGDVREI
ncbi:MAG: hypothetical protein GTO63_06360 [Anaerolineae bacterium]|nr:hypothetical protein [Anaerolineae bacterium]NIN94595.1 hypothetical protein [Anaerolineae bacterium]NIQ77656.1 hypothetical protein [Anaerolineae bacterium]